MKSLAGIYRTGLAPLPGYLNGEFLTMPLSGFPRVLGRITSYEFS